MATTYNGVNYGNYLDGKVLDQGLWGGKVQVAYDKFTYTGSSESGDKVYLCKLPKNARVLPISIVKTDKAVTLSVGIDGDAIKFLNSGSVNGAVTFSKATGDQLGADGPILVSIGSAASTPTIEMWVFYTQAG